MKFLKQPPSHKNKSPLDSDAALLFFKAYPLLREYLKNKEIERGSKVAGITLEAFMSNRRLADIKEAALKVAARPDYLTVLEKKPEEELTEREKMYIAKRKASA